MRTIFKSPIPAPMVLEAGSFCLESASVDAIAPAFEPEVFGCQAGKPDLPQLGHNSTIGLPARSLSNQDTVGSPFEREVYCCQAGKPDLPGVRQASRSLAQQLSAN
jgi:hypothetical protein